MTDSVKWGEGRENQFLLQMREELDRAIADRSPLEAIWRDHLDLYRAPEDSAVGYTPIEGASKRTFPLAAMHTDPILARYMRTIHAPANIWTLSPLNERWIDSAKPLQDYLQWIDHNQLKMWDVNMRVLQETLKLGTGIYKTGWRYERHKVTGYDSAWQRKRFIREINQPTVDHVFLQDLYIPSNARDIDPDAQHGAQWVAERHRWRPEQFEALAKAQEPFNRNFDPAVVKQIRQYSEVDQTEHQQEISKLDNLPASISLSYRRPIEVWEIHARFDTTGSGEEDDIEVLYHLRHQKILRATYARAPFRPYSVVRYLRGDGFYGIGICEQAKVWQEVISQLWNFNIDRVLMSNAPMLAMNENTDIVPNEPIYPGKQIRTSGDPSKDIVPIFLADKGPFDISHLMSFLQEGAKARTGVTDLQQGNVGALPSRTPATTVQSLLQEGSSRFDMSIQDIRFGGLSEVGLRVLQNLQFQTKNFANPNAQQYIELAMRLLGEPEGMEAARALTIPDDEISTGVGVQLTATSGSANKELQRQSFLALMQIVTQQAPMIVELATIATQQAGQPVGQIAVDLLRGEQELMTRLLEQFDVRNPEEIIPDVQGLFAQAAGQGGMAPPQPNQLAGILAQGMGGL
jgi:hypothetical protein